LVEVLAARDKGHRLYSGMVVGITQAGAELLDTMRPKQAEKIPLK
jgi:hypothetical protein